MTLPDTVTEWVDAHKGDRLFGYLLEHRSATIAELASIGGVSMERVIADMGGLHDYGIVTKFGNKAYSVVRLDFRIGRGANG